MQPGSIVELTKELTIEDIRLLILSGVTLSKGTPYIIESGPFKTGRLTDILQGIGDIAWIFLQEVPGHMFNSEYFSELEPPQEIDIQKLLPESIPEELLVLG